MSVGWLNKCRCNLTIKIHKTISKNEGAQYVLKWNNFQNMKEKAETV